MKKTFLMEYIDGFWTGKWKHTFAFFTMITFPFWISANAQQRQVVETVSYGDSLSIKDFQLAQNHFYLGYRYLPVEPGFMGALLDNRNIPTLDFRSFFLTLGYSLYRDWWYADLNFSIILSEEQTLVDLRSRLDQNSLGARFGYNLIQKPPLLITPYLGVRRTTYLHLTFPEAQSLDLDSYLSVGELDLRISQWAAVLGVQTRFCFRNGWAIGIDAAYLPHLHSQPIIRGEENRIRHSAESPLGHFTLGLTFSSFQTK